MCFKWTEPQKNKKKRTSNHTVPSVSTSEMRQKKINTFSIENIKNKEKAEVRCNKKAEGGEAKGKKLLKKRGNVVPQCCTQYRFKMPFTRLA